MATGFGPPASVGPADATTAGEWGPCGGVLFSHPDVLTRMLGVLRSWLAAVSGRDGAGETDEPEEDSDSGGFMPSRLDASVLFAHGRGAEFEEADDETVEELEAEARELERERREH